MGKLKRFRKYIFFKTDRPRKKMTTKKLKDVLKVSILSNIFNKGKRS